MFIWKQQIEQRNAQRCLQQCFSYYPQLSFKYEIQYCSCYIEKYAYYPAILNYVGVRLSLETVKVVSRR